MGHKPKVLGAISRREALSGVVACAGISLLPTVSLGQQAEALNDSVARQVRRLADGQSLTLRLLLPHGSSGNVTPVVSAFTAQTGVNIILVEKPVDDINTELLLDSMGTVQNYDIALPATFGLPDLVASNAITPITTFAKTYEPAGFRNDILFDIGDSFDGDIYGFQADGDAYLMFYHKDMLENVDEQARYADQFGKPLAIPQTWAELDAQMAYFHRPDDGQWGGLLFRTPGYLAWEWWVRFHAKGVWPFSPDMVPQIASDAGLAALEEMIRATQNLHPDATRLGLFQNWERYGKGDIYCNIGWGGSQKFLNSPQSQMRDRMVYGPTPGGVIDGTLIQTPYFNWGWDYVVPTNSLHPEIAYLFSLFASTPNMSTLAVQQTDGFFDPYRPEHYEDDAIKAAYSPAFLKVHRESLEVAIPDLYLRDQGEYFRVLGQWLTQALAGEVSPQTALNRIEQRWHLITNRSGRQSQVGRWAQLRAKYPPKLRAALRDLG